MFVFFHICPPKKTSFLLAARPFAPANAVKSGKIEHIGHVYHSNPVLGKVAKNNIIVSLQS